MGFLPIQVTAETTEFPVLYSRLCIVFNFWELRQGVLLRRVPRFLHDYSLAMEATIWPKFPSRWIKREGTTTQTPSLRMKTNQSPRRSRTLGITLQKKLALWLKRGTRGRR